MHVQVVGHLDGADDLVELPAEVLQALLCHHKVVLEVDGHALLHHVGREGALGLREGARGGLIGHPASQALVILPSGSSL